MNGKYYKRSDISSIKRLVLGAAIAVAVLLIFSAVFSGIAMLTKDATAMVAHFAIPVIVTAATVGGAVSSRTVSEGKLSLVALSALLASLIFMLIGAIVGKGHLPLSVFLNFLIFMGTFTLSGYLFKKRKNGARSKFKY